MSVSETVVDVLETVEVEKQHAEYVIVAVFSAFDFGFQKFGKH